MKEIELTYSRSQELLSNWDILDGLRDDEAIKGFGIRNKIETTFEDMSDNEKKLARERSELLQKLQEIIQARKEDENDDSAKETVIQQLPNGGFQIDNMPKDLNAEYRPKLNTIQKELNSMMIKTITVKINPLSRSDLEKHDMVKNKVLRQVPEIVDVLPKEQEVEVVENGQEAEEQPA